MRPGSNRVPSSALSRWVTKPGMAAVAFRTSPAEGEWLPLAYRAAGAPARLRRRAGKPLAVVRRASGRRGNSFWRRGIAWPLTRPRVGSPPQRRPSSGTGNSAQRLCHSGAAREGAPLGQVPARRQSRSPSANAVPTLRADVQRTAALTAFPGVVIIPNDSRRCTLGRRADLHSRPTRRKRTFTGMLGSPIHGRGSLLLTPFL